MTTSAQPPVIAPHGALAPADRVERGELTAADPLVIAALVRPYVARTDPVREKTASIRRLQRIGFGPTPSVATTCLARGPSADADRRRSQTARHYAHVPGSFGVAKGGYLRRHTRYGSVLRQAMRSQSRELVHPISCVS